MFAFARTPGQELFCVLVRQQHVALQCVCATTAAAHAAACCPAESIDMWGCGCVYGELLQRVAWIGKATTPQLQVRDRCMDASSLHGSSRQLFTAMAAGGLDTTTDFFSPRSCGVLLPACLAA
jgi:hypothetical protein